MGFSIQDYLKKINSWLSFIDILSLLATLMLLILLLLYLQYSQQENEKEVVYRVGVEEVGASVDKNTLHASADARPFGSVKGKTYTFSWCQGSSRISTKNKIYFGSEEEAKVVGRTLSKLCKK